MTPLTKTLAVSLALTLASLPALRAGTVDLPEYGFSIDLLDAKLPDTENITALMSFLPQSDGLSPNLNVQIQTYGGDMKMYVEQAKKEFGDMKITLIKEELRGDNEWMAEYEGNVQGSDLHFYSRAVAKGTRVYLVTSTAGQGAQWDKVGETLKARVESFKLK